MPIQNVAHFKGKYFCIFDYMFISFFLKLRQHGIKCSIKEYLDLMEGLQQGVVEGDLEEFYFLARASLVKHEGQFDAFDVLFGEYFHGKEGMSKDFWKDIPEEWLRAEMEKVIDPEDLKAIEEMGGLDELIDRFKKLMEEQERRRSEHWYRRYLPFWQ